MSEYINNSKIRVEILYEISQGVINKQNAANLIRQNKETIDSLTPNDVLSVVHQLYNDKIPMADLKIGINKILNVFHSSLKKYKITNLPENHFLQLLIDENTEMHSLLEKIRVFVKLINKPEKDTNISDLHKKVREMLLKMQNFSLHYQKKEDILFPYIEKIFPNYRCVSIMWAFHDDIRKKLKEIEITYSNIQSKNDLIPLFDLSQEQLKTWNRQIADLFFMMINIKFREENILFPTAYETISEKDWFEMLKQSEKIGFFGEGIIESRNALKSKGDLKSPFDYNSTHTEELFVNFGTGSLSVQQANLMFENLPVDITYIDENDKVLFFTQPKDRVFSRSVAVIGRTVQNCHPPDSVHIVEELLDNFKSGKKDVENFWIQMGKRFVLIQYFALRDEQGNYKGTMEVTQDISNIKELKGEKRLL